MVGFEGEKGAVVVEHVCQGNVQQHHNLIHSLVPVHHQSSAVPLFLLNFLNV